MDKKFITIFLLLLLITATYLGNRILHQTTRNNPGDLATCGIQGHARPVHTRIVSLAPSVTEILFMLGLGDKVVGVTRYCTYPSEARSKPKVGGYYDPNYEAVRALTPDLVIMLPEHEEPRQNLGRLGLNTLVVDHRNIAGILDSITVIGQVCGKEQGAEEAVRDLRARMEHIQKITSGLPRKRVLVCIGRDMGSEKIGDIYITGRNGFYNSLILLAGGLNAYDGNAAYPIVSKEGIICINPEVIIDMVPDLEGRDRDMRAVLNEWKSMTAVDAVRNNHVYVFGQDYTVIPGPRFIRVLEEMARVIHPEADWR